MGQLISQNRSRTTPSFLIAGAGDRGFTSLPSGLRLDQINSQQMIRWARFVYYRFLETSSEWREPLGVVLVTATGQGRVVFRLPVLLPDEHFLPIELVTPRGRSSPRTRTRSTAAHSARRGPSPRPPSSS